MNGRSRRAFLKDVGTGMLVAGAGTLVAELGIPTANAIDGPEELSFGKLEPLVRLMQETPVDKLQPLLVGKLKGGEADLRTLISAAALANARTFGGEDYVGYHCEMALLPALEMSSEMPKDRQALPVLKVLYRNTGRLQQVGGRKREVLRPVKAAAAPEGVPPGERLQEAVRAMDVGKAEALFAGISRGPADQAYNHLHFTVQDHANVHRVVLAHRSWQLVKLIGAEHAHTLLRQCVRFCVHQEKQTRKDGNDRRLRAALPKALDQHKLLGRTAGTRRPEDAWVSKFVAFIYRATREQAIDATAAALAEGMAPDAVALALTLVANQLILRHHKSDHRGPFVHGASTGVHAADAMNAWRHIARECDQRTAVVSLLVGASYMATGPAFTEETYPHQEHLERIKAADGKGLLAELDDAIRNNDQGRASALAQRYGERGLPERPIFDHLLRYAVSEDGKLHAEKYYRTATEEFSRTRPAFRWRHIVSLARVTASAHGLNGADKPTGRAPGYEEACRLLGVSG